MKPSLLSRRIPLFREVAVLVLFVVFFLVPFAFRGARRAVETMRNDVKDWLPSHFAETQQLRWFGQHFLGEQFIVVTWPGCTVDDPRFLAMVKELRLEIASDAKIGRSLDPDEILRAGHPDNTINENSDERRAEKLAAQLGLHYAGEYFENWGGEDEKWLAGDHDKWYFVTKEGKLYEWTGNANLVGWLVRKGQQVFTGNNTANGKLIAEFGGGAKAGEPNEFHENPRKLFARYFKTVQTGPELVERLAGENGSLRRGPDEDSADAARWLAYNRLTGVLFGPEAPEGFPWTIEAFQAIVPAKKIEELPDDWQEAFTTYVDNVVETQYEGDREQLVHIGESRRSQHWNELFAQFRVSPPARQTCILLTLSDAAKQDLSRVCGRSVLGKPCGRILELAVNHCGIDENDLRLGGPPIDNVAIDQEGSLTLVRLVNFSAIVGMTLAYLCFNRSIKMMLMVFFVGGVSAMASLSIVYWTGSTPDAITMSMPSLVYVMGLSGAVHIINYYRDSVQEYGAEGAAEKALKLGWFPCTLAAFTTALGLGSLYVSTLTPIQKFGMFSACGVMATVIVLFTYLPSALHVWAPVERFQKDDGKQSRLSFANFLVRFWDRVGDWIVQRHGRVTIGCVIVLIVFGIGLPKIGATVQLLKLFDKHATIIRDYKWMESNLGKLVPMELVVCVDPEAMQPSLDVVATENNEDLIKYQLQYGFLERAEIADRVQKVVEREFGVDGSGVVGRGMSTSVLIPEFPPADDGGVFSNVERTAFKRRLEANRHELLNADYLRLDNEDDRELWRISLRLGALNDVDYGDFVGDLKYAVEPVVSAYRYRNKILRRILEQRNELNHASVMILGADPNAKPSGSDDIPSGERASSIDQTAIFAQTLDELLRNKGFRHWNSPTKMPLIWYDPAEFPPADEKQSKKLANTLAGVDVLVIASDKGQYDLEFARQHAKTILDARDDHKYDPKAAITSETRKVSGDPDADITVVYTGIVPIVYKSQWALMRSLIDSIGLAFIMIAVVMMILLRDWKRPPSLGNSLNVSAGIVSMLPNVFPVIVVFGAMGHLGLNVDIGSMMTASVAMGIAVDDTIHFLNWFRLGLREGRSRIESIKMAYHRCATAMTQTTLIGGFGLAVFALSTFTPTQQFGILMLVLLAMALIGDLIFLPALLAGPLGRYFEIKDGAEKKTPSPKLKPETSADGPHERQESTSVRYETPHSTSKSSDRASASVTRNKGAADSL